MLMSIGEQPPPPPPSVVVTVQLLLSPASPSPLPSVVAWAAVAVPESSTVDVKSLPVASALVGASELNSTVILLLAVTLVVRSTLMLLPDVLFVYATPLPSTCTPVTVGAPKVPGTVIATRLTPVSPPPIVAWMS